MRKDRIKRSMVEICKAAAERQNDQEEDADEEPAQGCQAKQYRINDLPEVYIKP